MFRPRQAGNSLHHRQKGGHQDGEPRETQRVGAHEGESWYFALFDMYKTTILENKLIIQTTDDNIESIDMRNIQII